MDKKRLRTFVYVDGFNFYYGQLKGTPWKWLDLSHLFERVLGSQNEIIKVKYFTAKVQPTAHDPDVNLRQDTYFRALRHQCEKVEIYLGHFLRHRVSMEHANPPPDVVKVWKNEEKGSDVNLAVQLLNDAWLDRYDCAVIVSNDSDLAMSMNLVRSQHRKLIGLITPGSPKRKTSQQLLSNADFIRPIRTHVLQESLLPDEVLQSPSFTMQLPSFNEPVCSGGQGKAHASENEDRML